MFFRAKDFWEARDESVGVCLAWIMLLTIEILLNFLAEYNDIYFRFGAVYEDILGKDNNCQHL